MDKERVARLHTHSLPQCERAKEVGAPGRQGIGEALPDRRESGEMQNRIRRRLSHRRRAGSRIEQVECHGLIPAGDAFPARGCDQPRLWECVAQGEPHMLADEARSACHQDPAHAGQPIRFR